MELESALGALTQDSDEKRWSKAIGVLASAVADAFGVAANDVAILARTSDNLRLKFEHPPALASGVNAFPVGANSFASDLARGSRGVIENGFAVMKHLAFYERIQAKEQGPATIQKIMGAPVRADRLSFVVVEVSRKGANAASAGPDFTPADLARLVAICDAAAPFLKQLRPTTP